MEFLLSEITFHAHTEIRVRENLLLSVNAALLVDFREKTSRDYWLDYSIDYKSVFLSQQLYWGTIIHTEQPKAITHVPDLS